MAMSIPHLSRSQQGTTLIEALVSILVMSLGLLGLAGLQAGALGFQKSAWSTHRVAEFTGNFGERVRANPKAVDADYQYTDIYATGKAATLTKLNCRTSATACTPAQIAADDLADLLQKAQASLPQGSMQITGTITNGFVITALYLDKDFRKSDGTLDTSATCTATTTGVNWRNCCPDTAAAPDGVRCRRFTVIP
jgi:type IV pilus assembly protein PilV